MRFTLPTIALFAAASASSVLALSTPHDGLLERRQNTTTGGSGGSSAAGRVVAPSAPGPGDVFRAGQTCGITWAPATSARWRSMTISLMTGANQNMSKVEDVVTGIDGTTVTTHSWTCPEVTPYSAIYFYQFTNNADADPQWTTRFTIASPDGETTTPEFATQPEGPAIPWGIGRLANGASSGSGSGSGSGSSSDDSSSSTSTSATSAPTSSSTTSSASSTSTRAPAQTSAPSGAAGSITPLKATSLVAALAVAFIGAML